MQGLTHHVYHKFCFEGTHPPPQEKLSEYVFYNSVIQVSL